jgi:hypothetical protein
MAPIRALLILLGALVDDLLAVDVLVLGRHLRALSVETPRPPPSSNSTVAPADDPGVPIDPLRFDPGTMTAAEVVRALLVVASFARAASMPAVARGSVNVALRLAEASAGGCASPCDFRSSLLS